MFRIAVSSGICANNARSDRPRFDLEAMLSNPVKNAHDQSRNERTLTSLVACPIGNAKGRDKDRFDLPEKSASRVPVHIASFDSSGHTECVNRRDKFFPYWRARSKLLFQMRGRNLELQSAKLSGVKANCAKRNPPLRVSKISPGAKKIFE